MSGLVIDGLANLPEQTILDESALAGLLKISGRTVRRMVGRNELPPGIPLGGRSVWLVGRVLRHLNQAAAEAEVTAAKEAARLAALG